MSRLVYLAGPYTHTDKTVEGDRYKIHRAVCAYMMRNENVFSPIVHGHNLLPELADFSGADWSKWNKAFLRHASEVVVIDIPGCDDSKGLQFELNMAKELGIPVRKCNLLFFMSHEAIDALKLTHPKVSVGIVPKPPVAPEDMPDQYLCDSISDRLYVHQITNEYADYIYESLPTDGFVYQVFLSYDFENELWGEMTYQRCVIGGEFRDIEEERMNRTIKMAAVEVFEKLTQQVEDTYLERISYD